MGLRVVTIKIEEDLLDPIEEIKRSMGMSRSEVIRTAMIWGAENIEKLSATAHASRANDPPRGRLVIVTLKAGDAFLGKIEEALDKLGIRSRSEFARRALRLYTAGKVGRSPRGITVREPVRIVIR